MYALISHQTPFHCMVSSPFVLTLTNSYRQQTKLREGNVFTRFCHSLHSGERGMMYLSVCFYVSPRGGVCNVTPCVVPCFFQGYYPKGVWSQNGYSIPYPWYWHLVVATKVGSTLLEIHSCSELWLIILSCDWAMTNYSELWLTILSYDWLFWAMTGYSELWLKWWLLIFA